MSTSRTAPRAHGITSVVSTARTPTSWQMARSSAFTPVESAAVSSVMLPMPMNRGAAVRGAAGGGRTKPANNNTTAGGGGGGGLGGGGAPPARELFERRLERR